MGVGEPGVAVLSTVTWRGKLCMRPSSRVAVAVAEPSGSNSITRRRAFLAAVECAVGAEGDAVDAVRVFAPGRDRFFRRVVAQDRQLLRSLNSMPAPSQARPPMGRPSGPCTFSKFQVMSVVPAQTGQPGIAQPRSVHRVISREVHAAPVVVAEAEVGAVAGNADAAEVAAAPRSRRARRRGRCSRRCLRRRTSCRRRRRVRCRVTLCEDAAVPRLPSALTSKALIRSSRAVVDVEDFFVGRKGEPVRIGEVVRPPAWSLPSGPRRNTPW